MSQSGAGPGHRATAASSTVVRWYFPPRRPSNVRWLDRPADAVLDLFRLLLYSGELQPEPSARARGEPASPADACTSSSLSTPVISSSLATSGCGRANTRVPRRACSALAASSRTRRLAESRNDNPDASTVTSRAPVPSWLASTSCNNAAPVESASPDSTTTGPPSPADAEILSATTNRLDVLPPAGRRALPTGKVRRRPGRPKPPAVPSTASIRIRTLGQLQPGPMICCLSPPVRALPPAGTRGVG